jgi:hypothetical protein
MILFNRLLTVELINGCGIYLEFADSRAVWGYNAKTEETFAMPFEGIILSLPFCMISYGRVYDYEQD